MSNNKEKVNHPEHYGGEENPYEAIKVIESLGINVAFGMCIGNALKYISRAGKKGNETTLDDLQKANWYLKRCLQYMQTRGEVSTFFESNKIALWYGAIGKVAEAWGIRIRLKNCFDRLYEYIEKGNPQKLQAAILLLDDEINDLKK